MRDPVKVRPVLSIAAVLLATALAVAGCGGGGGSSGTDPASAAPPESPLYIEVAVRPQGELSSNIDSLAKRVAGIDDLGELVVSELEQSASDSGEPFDYEKEIEPWLGEKAGVFFKEYNGNDFSGYGVAVQTTDAAATQEFIDKQAKSDAGPAEDGSYHGVDFKVEKDDGMTVGVVDDLLVLAEDEATFKRAVDASGGESLADEASFGDATAAAPSNSFADVFIDIGGLIEASGNGVDPEAKLFLESAGIDPTEATAVAGLVPGSDRLEVDISTDISSGDASAGDASDLLGSLPRGSVGAFASSEFGKRFDEAINSIDARGIPGQVPPHELKRTLKQAGVDLEAIASSIGDIGAFVEGNSERSLGGAVVFTTKDATEASNTVGAIGLLLRATGTPGVTSIGGKASGFSIRSPELGRQPVVVAAEGEKIAISYGLKASAAALSGKAGTLSEDPTYEEAVSALGSTPISGFVDGQMAVRLASALLPPDEEEGFAEAKPYLNKIDYLALGSGTSGDLTTAKLIVGVGK
jgi:hypothetical protein